MLLAVTTFALALAAQNYIYTLPLFGGGQSGSVSFIRGSLFGLNLSSQRSYYYVVPRRSGSGVGRSRQTPTLGGGASDDRGARQLRLSRELHLSPARTRIQAFALAGAIAGLGGALLAGTIESVPYDQEFFLVNDSLVLVAMVVIGGLGSVSGAVIGAVWIIGLPAFFPNNQLVPLFTSSIGLLVMLLYFPGGFAQIGTSIRNSLIATGGARAGPPPPKRSTALPRAAVTAVARHRRWPRRSGTSDGDERRALERPPMSSNSVCNSRATRRSRRCPSKCGSREVVALIGANGAGKVDADERHRRLRALDRGGAATRIEMSQRMSVHARAALGLGRTFQGADAVLRTHSPRDGTTGS